MNKNGTVGNSCQKGGSGKGEKGNCCQGWVVCAWVQGKCNGGTGNCREREKRGSVKTEARWDVTLVHQDFLLAHCERQQEHFPKQRMRMRKVPLVPQVSQEPQMGGAWS